PQERAAASDDYPDLKALHAVRADGRKVIWEADGRRVWAYDLAADPDELGGRVLVSDEDA
ncbi:sulfatase, partial [Streptomyces sp. SID7499]|nr:sulfatase [Streptomyces sp. SID7499]